MVNRLGLNWAISLLGFLAIALMPGPWISIWFGPRLRARSKYAPPVAAEVNPESEVSNAERSVP
jgi:hypothetical protein